MISIRFLGTHHFHHWRFQHGFVADEEILIRLFLDTHHPHNWRFQCVFGAGEERRGKVDEAYSVGRRSHIGHRLP
jgi:hypothetical protein